MSIQCNHHSTTIRTINTECLYRCINLAHDAYKTMMRGSSLESSEINFIEQNLFECDISDATAIFFYLTPDGVDKVSGLLSNTQFECLRRNVTGSGLRILTVDFPLQDEHWEHWLSDKTLSVMGLEMFVYEIPAGTQICRFNDSSE